MLPQRIKTLREQKGVLQIDLAQAMGVTQGTIGNWETGKRTPDTQMLQRLANYFDVSADCLLGSEDSKVSMLTRKLAGVPQEDREFILSNLNNTLDVYLKSKGLLS
ncbi:MAG: helix-turn-helix domain-containing protein [Oscillospiraceae bacterium]|nr:helix-turn-helix domain-containing protein [Oscillospiraceae bacterium]